MNQYRNPVQVNVFPFRMSNKQIEFLLMRRLPHRGGFWQGVSGGVDILEDINVAAHRELREETGFEAPVHFINHRFSYPVEGYKHPYAPDVKSVVDHAFVADVTNFGDPVLSNEHDTFKWLQFNQINLEDLKWEENKTALIKANEFINEHYPIETI